MIPPLSRAQIEDVVLAATQAPSILNTQPWRFVARGDLIELHRARDRALPVTDPVSRALTVSCGAALMNLRLAVAAMGRLPEVQLLPDEGVTTLLATVRAVEPHVPTSAELRLRRSI